MRTSGEAEIYLSPTTSGDLGTPAEEDLCLVCGLAMSRDHQFVVGRARYQFAHVNDEVTRIGTELRFNLPMAVGDECKWPRMAFELLSRADATDHHVEQHFFFFELGLSFRVWVAPPENPLALAWIIDAKTGGNLIDPDFCLGAVSSAGSSPKGPKPG